LDLSNCIEHPDIYQDEIDIVQLKDEMGAPFILIISQKEFRQRPIFFRPGNRFALRAMLTDCSPGKNLTFEDN
jgi:hypothetical protein